MSNSLQTHEIQYARLPCPSLFQSLLRLMLIELMIPPNHLALCCHLMLLLSIFPSIWVFFQWIGCSQQVVKVLELQLQHSLNIPMNIQGWFPLGLTGLISLLSKRLKSLLQHHGSKASILQCSAFLMVQLSHSYMTTGKTIALTTWTFVSKVMSLLFSMLSGFVITFLPRSKRLLILWLQSLYAVTLEPKKIKSALFLLFPYLGKLLNI